ncbi:TldD/PmbA family protein [Candidatus Latescibacterota bacterium]
MEQVLKSAIADLVADYAEVRIERAESTALSYMGPELEQIGTSFTLVGCVRVCIRGGWGFASFTHIEDVPASAQAAARMAELCARDRTRLAPVEPVIASVRDEVGIDPVNVPVEDKHSLLKRYNDMMLAEPGIVTTTAHYHDSKKDLWLHTSEGTLIHQEKTRAGVSIMAVAKEGPNIQRGHRSFGDTRGYGTVLNRESDVADVVRITRDLIRAPKVSGGLSTVILDPQLAGVFCHEAFGHLSESDFVYENPQAREMMKLGRRFGPDFLNIIDSGILSGENGYVAYDDEGVPGGKTHLIQNGLLVGRLHSRETAVIMEESPTGNARAISALHQPIVRMTTTYIDRGETPFEDMLSSEGDGIYACGFLGGNTDLERFTFSSAYAYRIENGSITTPLRDVILSGNVFETMKNITAIGDDLTLFGGLGGCGKGGQGPLPVSDGSPHICIKNVLVG